MSQTNPTAHKIATGRDPFHRPTIPALRRTPERERIPSILVRSAKQWIGPYDLFGELLGCHDRALEERCDDCRAGLGQTRGDIEFVIDPGEQVQFSRYLHLLDLLEEVQRMARLSQGRHPR